MYNICCNFKIKKNFLTKTLSLKFLKFTCKSWSIVFFGSDNYSMHCLKGLHKLIDQKLIRKMEVVVSNEATSVYNYAVSNGFKTHVWPPTFKESFDFGVLASFGKLIPKNIIDLCTLGIFNVHASLLPKFRGGLPIVHAIKNGEVETGITVIRIVPHKFDAGEIILQKSCSIGENELMPSLYKKLSILGCECLLEVINTLPECLSRSFPQSDKNASYAPVLSKKAAVVNWKNMTALEIFNLHRALFGMFELMTTWEGQAVKLMCLSLNTPHSSSVQLSQKKSEPGCFTYDKDTEFLYVQCKDKPITLCTIKFKLKMCHASKFYKRYLCRIPENFWKFI